MKRVFVCIPAYREIEGIKRLLESVRIQDYPDIEVIISDDSPDGEIRALAASYIPLFAPRKIFYFRNTKPLGAPANWNAAVSRALDSPEDGYIKLMHHDDFFTSENSVSEFVRLLEDNPEADLAFSGSRQVSADPSRTYDRTMSEASEQALRADFRQLYLENQIGAPSAVMVRKAFLKEHGIRYDERLTWLVDSDYYLQILSVNPRFARTEKPLVSIGTGDAQLTARVSSDPEILRREYSLLYRKYRLEDVPEKRRALYREKLLSVLAETGTSFNEADPELHITGKEMRAAEKQAGKAERERLFSTFRYLYEKWTRRLYPLALVLFMTALTAEILVVIVDKSDHPVPAQALIFRATFALFFLKALLTRYEKEELIWIAVFLAMAVLTWRISGKEELIRMVVYVAALKDVPIRKVMQYTLVLTAAGSAVLVILSAAGIFGNKVLISDTSGLGTVQTRWSFGFGHPNALHCMAMMLMLLVIALYGEKIGKAGYAAMFVLNFLLYLLTKAESGFLSAALAIVIAYLFSVSTPLRENRTAYIAGEILFVICLLFSLLSASYGDSIPWMMRLNRLLTGRISALWDTNYFEGTVMTWGLFAPSRNQYYFDMGWVRLVYWYGLIPAAMMLAVIFGLFREIRKNKDAFSYVLLLVCCLYTTLEAHLVSVFLLRNYVLFLVAMYAGSLFGRQTGDET